MLKILKFSAPSIAVTWQSYLISALVLLRGLRSGSSAMWHPYLKKDDATSVSNYRPISVLSIIPKILEKVMFDQRYDVFQPLF